MFVRGGVSWTIDAICFEAPHACPPCCPLTDVSRDRAADGQTVSWREGEQRRRLAGYECTAPRGSSSSSLVFNGGDTNSFKMHYRHLLVWSVKKTLPLTPVLFRLD